jgi:hypothetical protein
LNIIIVNEIIKFLKVDIWNILNNYVKKFLLLIDDDAQLRSIILSDSNQNEFVYSMLMSLFHRLKLLKHSSMLLKIQYRMLINWSQSWISNMSNNSIRFKSRIEHDYLFDESNRIWFVVRRSNSTRIDCSKS